MTVEMTLDEAALLIAILTGAEGTFAVTSPPLTEALKDLRAWRSILLRTYVLARLNEAQAVEEPASVGAVARATD
jgi:hypothetical protein